MLNLVPALLAGVVTIAAPCTLPVLPILLGASVGRVRPAMIAAGFVMSFSATARSFPQILKLTLFSNARTSDMGGRAEVKVIARRPCVVGEVQERSNHLAQFQM